MAVASSLERKAFPIFVPTYQEVRQYSDRVKKVQSALFPGYIFCRLDPERCLPVLTTPGVHAIVRSDEKPAPIAEDIIEAIKKVVPEASAKPWP